jgi:HEAT repeat protein
MDRDEGRQEPLQEPQAEKLPLDARLLSEAVVEFNISRRNVGLYPPGHAAIRSSILRAHDLFGKLFELRDAITLGIAEDCLMVDEYALDKKNPVYRECALSFHERGIASVTFLKGLSEEELTVLNELLTDNAVPPGQGLADLGRERGLARIRLTPIDYSHFTFVEGTASGETERSALWETYARGMLEGTLVSEEAHEALLGAPAEEVAALINQTAPGGEAPQSYERFITSYLKGRGKTGLQAEGMSSLFSVIENLSPELRKQLLAETAHFLSSDPEDAERVLREMTAGNMDRILDVLKDYDAMVPETLRNVIAKLSAVAPKEFVFDLRMSGDAVVHDIQMDNELTGLFREDNFERYVSRDYQETLNAMLRQRARGGGEPLKGLPEQCSEEAVERTASDVMVELLQSGPAEGDVQGRMLATLVDLTEKFIDTGRFGDALALYEKVVQHAGGPDAVERFSSEEFHERVVEAVLAWGWKSRESATGLVLGMGKTVVEPLMDALIREGQAGRRKYILTLLRALGEKVVPSVLTRLQDERWYVLRNMVYLLRECGEPRHAEQVRKFAKHPDLRVSMEALRTLLSFGAPEGVPLLKLYVQSQDLETRTQAVRLAGFFKVAETVPLLVEHLERRDVLGNEAVHKVPLVRALGEIGDPRAIASLVKMLKAKSFMFRGAAAELRREIFKNLSNYPPEAREPVLRLGLRQSDPEIRSLCEQLRREGDGNA